MLNVGLSESVHFSLINLSEGVYACIHKPGGAAYSNAGIIDLGDRTILVDAFDTMAAGRDLCHTAEALFERQVETIILTHPHSDHWIGASAFDASTTILANMTTHQVCLRWGEEIMEDFQKVGGWEQWLVEAEQKLHAEQDERVRASLENSISHTRYIMAEMADFQPRYADQTFEGAMSFEGSGRTAELQSFGQGHSEDDAVLLLPQDDIAFIGDIGFFDTQPYLGFCEFDLYRHQLLRIFDTDFRILVPGHGPVGGMKDIALQLKYFDVMEELVGGVAQRNGSFEDALQVRLPEPFHDWQVVGQERFEVNVRYLFSLYGGELPIGE